jgi:ribose-phosphate pyrophosphokinase
LEYQILAEYFKRKIMAMQRYCCCKPDVGSVDVQGNLPKELIAPIAMIDKRRPKPMFSEVMNVTGDVKGKKTVLRWMT